MGGGCPDSEGLGRPVPGRRAEDTSAYLKVKAQCEMLTDTDAMPARTARIRERRKNLTRTRIRACVKGATRTPAVYVKGMSRTARICVPRD